AGEVSRLQAALSDAARREAVLLAERDELGQKLSGELRSLEQARARASALDAEVQRLSQLEPQAAETPRLRRELAHAHEVLQQRTQQAEAAARAAHLATTERERVKEQAAVELQARASEVARSGSELQAARRRLADLEAERAAREGQIARLQGEIEAGRRSAAEQSVEAERRSGAEVERLKAALVDLERRLESSARAEAQARRRLTEADRERAEQVALRAQQTAAEKVLDELREELEDLKRENDFLNAEVARYHQKNKELLAQAGRKG
ncbi:MAG TPA: response regulator, partial [Anaeromyxobacteraceae bacterium]|nr:response regulator [Anaeromyxobacteraceae bacterium]